MESLVILELLVIQYVQHNNLHALFINVSSFICRVTQVKMDNQVKLDKEVKRWDKKTNIICNED